MVLFVGFNLAIGLGLARIVLMLALASRRRRHAEPVDPAAALPRVDVLVAAYNEATVIRRTLDSLLASRDVEVSVLVVDDGSTDGTYEVVAEAFGHDPRVRLRRKPNGTKASALNLALTEATAPVVGWMRTPSCPATPWPGWPPGSPIPASGRWRATSRSAIAATWSRAGSPSNISPARTSTGGPWPC